MERDLIADGGIAPIDFDNQSARNESFSDYLDKLCVYWMHYGVPYDVFWNGDYTQLKYYAEAYKLDVERRNQELWLQGMYNYEAFATVMSRMMDKHSKAKYPDKPYRITELSEDEKEAENKRVIEDFRKKLNAINENLAVKQNRKGVVVAESSK